MPTHKATSVINGVRSLYEEDETAKAFFDRAAERKNDVAQTYLERIAQMAGNIPRHEAVNLAKQLEEVGCGRLIVGRKGWRTRFQWDFSLPTLGKVAQGETSELEDIAPDVKADAEDQQSVAAAAGEGSGLTIPEAKRRLAETLGISPDNIEIQIKA